MCEAGWEKLCRAAGSVGPLGVVGGFGAGMVMSETGKLPVRRPVELLAVRLAGDSRVALVRKVARLCGSTGVGLGGHQREGDWERGSAGVGLGGHQGEGDWERGSAGVGLGAHQGKGDWERGSTGVGLGGHQGEGDWERGSAGVGLGGHQREGDWERGSAGVGLGDHQGEGDWERGSAAVGLGGHQGDSYWEHASTGVGLSDCQWKGDWKRSSAKLSLGGRCKWERGSNGGNLQGTRRYVWLPGTTSISLNDRLGRVGERSSGDARLIARAAGLY